MSYELTTDPRVPAIPDDDFRFDFPIRESYLGDAWREGYAACLKAMDAGRFDQPTPGEIKATWAYGFTVRKVDFGLGPTDVWEVVYENQSVGGVHNTKRQATTAAVARWREETRYS